MFYKLLLSLFFALPLLSMQQCDRKKEENQKKVYSKNELKEPLIKTNQNRVKNESIVIDSYIERHNLSMIETGTGLRYQIYYTGSGEMATVGKIALIKSSISLLDGTVCYKSPENKVEDFMVGQSDKESGLHEGIQLMRVGDKARMILPSHLAHGLVGDFNKIPSSAVIIYDVELIGLR